MPRHRVVSAHNRDAASQRVLEKAGFRREGLLRAYFVVDGERADALMCSLLPADLA